MDTISQQIEKAVELCREHGIEPDRVRMDIDAYRTLLNETLIAEGKEPLDPSQDILATLGQVHGLNIMLVVDPPSILCGPSGYFAVDRAPDDY